MVPMWFTVEVVVAVALWLSICGLLGAEVVLTKLVRRGGTGFVCGTIEEIALLGVGVLVVSSSAKPVIVVATAIAAAVNDSIASTVISFVGSSDFPCCKLGSASGSGSVQSAVVGLLLLKPIFLVECM